MRAHSLYVFAARLSRVAGAEIFRTPPTPCLAFVSSFFCDACTQSTSCQMRR